MKVVLVVALGSFKMETSNGIPALNHHHHRPVDKVRGGRRRRRTMVDVVVVALALLVDTTTIVPLPTHAFATLRSSSRAALFPQRQRLAALSSSSSSSDSNKNNSNFNLDELYARIENLQKQEQVIASDNDRDDTNNDDNSDNSAIGQQLLPVICWDALLPGQRMTARTTDETMTRFLQTMSVGGIFCMVSLDYRQRKVRRDGVLCKIEVQDAPTASSSSSTARFTTTDRLSDIPTAVDFVLVGLRHCRVQGPATNMQARIGRWRRAYDPEGEETKLGWGLERFVDAPTGIAVKEQDDKEEEKKKKKNHLFGEDANDKDQTLCLPSTEWSDSVVQTNNLRDADAAHDETVKLLAQEIPALLAEWESLAADTGTYENTNVVATVRHRKGHAQLKVHPDALLRQVKATLGPMPDAVDDDPTALAFYGAALINPIPALGVAPEIRGRVLSAPTALERLQILAWGVRRSIRNLQGIAPL